MHAGVSKNQCVRQFGQVHCENHTVGNLNASGVVYLNNMTVKTACQLQGKVQIVNSVMGKLNTYGQLIIEATIVHGPSRLYGNGLIQRTHYQNSLWIWSNEISASNSTFDADIVIHGDSHRACSVILSENTKILGDIVFKGCTGRIELKTGSSVYGAIVDGEVVT